jgi:hypothetical protein
MLPRVVAESFSSFEALIAWRDWSWFLGFAAASWRHFYILAIRDKGFRGKVMALISAKEIIAWWPAL